MALTSTQWVVLVISTVISCFLLRSLWRSRDPLFFKLLLSLVGLIPLLGPLILLWNNLWPSRWPEGMQAKFRNHVNQYTYPKAVDSNTHQKQ
jgi:hypothetical protein